MGLANTDQRRTKAEAGAEIMIDIEKLTDRERDALVATRLMCFVSQGVGSVSGDDLWNKGQWDSSTFKFKPSTDPAANYQMRQKMRELGWKLATEDFEDGRTSAWWRKISLERYEQGQAIGATELSASVLAALRAVGATEGDDR